jgi:hypothetical protein
MTRRSNTTPIVSAMPDGNGHPDASLAEGLPPASPVADVAPAVIDPGVRHRLICEAAYALYVARGCQHGSDTDDWLVAETRVDRELQSGITRA